MRLLITGGNWPVGVSARPRPVYTKDWGVKCPGTTVPPIHSTLGGVYLMLIFLILFFITLVGLDFGYIRIP